MVAKHGMEIHPREQLTRKAESELSEAIIQIVEKHARANRCVSLTLHVPVGSVAWRSTRSARSATAARTVPEVSREGILSLDFFRGIG